MANGDTSAIFASFPRCPLDTPDQAPEMYLPLYILKQPAPPRLWDFTINFPKFPGVHVFLFSKNAKTVAQKCTVFSASERTPGSSTGEHEDKSQSNGLKIQECINQNTKKYFGFKVKYVDLIHHWPH